MTVISPLFIKNRCYRKEEGFAMARKDSQKLNQCNILSAITLDDIINTDNVLDKIMTAKKETLLSKHPYKITEPKSENGRCENPCKISADNEKDRKNRNL